MKIVLDTNVLISALIFPGVSSEVFDAIIQNHTIILSEWILAEFTDKCREKFKIPVNVLSEITQHLREKIIIEEPIGQKPEICRDPDDNNILWLAQHVSADLLVTGDQDLLVLKNFKNTQIISPRQNKAEHMNL